MTEGRILLKVEWLKVEWLKVEKTERRKWLAMNFPDCFKRNGTGGFFIIWIRITVDEIFNLCLFSNPPKILFLYNHFLCSVFSTISSFLSSVIYYIQSFYIQPFYVRSFYVRSFSTFSHSTFGHSMFGLSTFGPSTFGQFRQMIKSVWEHFKMKQFNKSRKKINNIPGPGDTGRGK
jgi:hypothetical protein